MPSSRTSEIAKRSPGAFETYKAYATEPVAAGDIVRVVGVTDGGAYYNVVKATADGSQTGNLLVASTASDASGYLLVAKKALLPMDTSGSTLGAPAYLSDSTPGALSLATTLEQVGAVVFVGTSGLVEVEPATASSAPQKWPGQVEVEGLTVDAQPAEGETYELSLLTEDGLVSTVYTFTSTPVAATDVERDGTVAQIQAALEAAINANQGEHVFATDYGSPDPLLLVGLRGAVQIGQVDGTSGDLTLMKTGSATAIGLPALGEGRVEPFHFVYNVTAENVSQGFITFVTPEGWQVDNFSFLVYDIAAKGFASTTGTLVACTATAAALNRLAEPFNTFISITNAGATPFTANHQVVVWGLMRYVGP